MRSGALYNAWRQRGAIYRAALWQRIAAGQQLHAPVATYCPPWLVCEPKRVEDRKAGQW